LDSSLIRCLERAADRGRVPAEITAEKHAVFVGTPALAPFIGAKMQAVLGTPVGYCGGANNSPAPVVVPLVSSCLEVVNFGGTRTVERAGSAGVQIAVVPAFHDNGIPNSLLTDPLSTELGSQGLTFQPAPPVGSVIPSHGNEVATNGGVVIPGTKTAQFLKAIEMPGYVPLSGRTMQFDGEGRCVAVCN
jgi:hypothetical protein